MKSKNMNEIEELIVQQGKDARARKVRPIIINPILKGKITNMSVPEFLVCCCKVFRCLPVNKVAKYLDMSRQAVDKRYRKMLTKNKFI